MNLMFYFLCIHHTGIGAPNDGLSDNWLAHNPMVYRHGPYWNDYLGSDIIFTHVQIEQYGRCHKWGYP